MILIHLFSVHQFSNPQFFRRSFASQVKQMTDFQKAIAEQVSALAGLTLEQVIGCVEEPKNLGKADLAIPVAKLNKFKKLPGNPAAIAAEWKDKVNINSIIYVYFIAIVNTKI